jgi:hypothetical protein
VALTVAMTKIVTEIMVEVLKIFGIATKEIRRGSASEFQTGCIQIFAELRRAEKFLRKLAGMVDLENALKKLDRLTQEEARLALAEVMRITHSIRDEVKVVNGKVESVENKVVDMGNKVDVVGDNVGAIDEKVQVVIEGA